MYHIRYSNQAEKFIRKQDNKLQTAIKKRMELVAQNPYSPNTNLNKLQGSSNNYRLRLGNISVLYEVDTKNNIISVWKIDFRGAVYKK